MGEGEGEERERTGKGKKVCVTGGTGFVASWLIMRLLHRGYSVRATLRNPPSPEGMKRDISYLTNLPFASERLQIFTADLDDPESFKPAIEGCTAVFHVAHPMDPNGHETEETVTKRSVEGLMGILRACVDARTVKRFFYTSSAVTVFYGGGGGGGGEVDESVWSDVEVFRRQEEKRVSSSYVASKIAAETAALEFGENNNNGLEVVTLVIPLVVGPFLSPSLPSSVFISLAFLFENCKEKYLFDTYNMVHIDDVARALIFLLERPHAKGRFICSSVEMTIDEVFGFLSTRFPQFHLPSLDMKKYKTEKRVSLSSQKLKSEGFEFKYGAEDIFSGAIESCKARGFL